MVSDQLGIRTFRHGLHRRARRHIQCLIECECGLPPHLRDVLGRSSIRASGRSRSTSMKQARPVLLRSSRTPPYASSTVLISRDPNPALRGCYARELGQHEKNGRPVQADCEAIEGGSPRVGRASRVQVPLRNGATSTSRARCWSKKSPSAFPRSVVSVSHESKTARCSALFRSTSIVSWNTFARR
jgi:hypothetical protein